MTNKLTSWNRASWHCQKPENMGKPECQPAINQKPTGWKNDDGSSTVNAKAPEKELGLPTVKQNSDNYWSMLGGIGGSLFGLMFAFNKKSGFWGYLGYWFLFGTIGSLGGKLVDVTLGKED